jgi:uncharacterized protein (DUF1800 family)
MSEAALDPRGYLLAQLSAGPADREEPSPGSPERLAAERTLMDLGSAPGAVEALRRSLAEADLLARARFGAETTAPYRERWLLFWLNHFALRRNGGSVEMLAGAFAREAIEPHLMGPLEDLFAAAVRHPAMLIALDQTESVGPGSPLGRISGRGLNENLAREVLELHSVGVESGYDQGDVLEMAKALTGWTYGDLAAPPELRGRFVDDGQRKEPGARRLLGQTYAEGPDRAERMVRDLANRPETRRRIALKAARHFVADEPAPALVQRLLAALDASGGSLKALAEALALAPESWAPQQRKLKTPYEFLVSAYRAVGSAPDDAVALGRYVEASGHSPLWSATAAGSSDRAETWASPMGLVVRADLARAVAPRAGERDPVGFAADALGPLLRSATRRAISSPGQEPGEAVALALMSPEFQRR